MPKFRLTFKRFWWIFFFVLLTIVFILQFAYNFVANCIFEWPIRWDVKVCWNEQINPAKEKAIEVAGPFMPDLKI